MNARDDLFRKDQRILSLIEESIREIELMTIPEREHLMHHLIHYMISDRLGLSGRSVLQTFHKLCISECLQEKPDWEVPSAAF